MGSKCIDIEVSHDKWLLHFENVTYALADFVIAANGGMSKIRKYVTDTLVEDTGTMIIQGDIPQPELNAAEFFRFCNGNRTMTSYQGHLLVVNPCNNNELSYGIILKTGFTGYQYSKSTRYRKYPRIPFK